MTIFNCKRCNFETQYKHVLIQHLNRKRECIPVASDVSRDDLLKELIKPKQCNPLACTYCNKTFTERANRYRHEKSCVERTTAPCNVNVVTEVKQHDKNQNTDILNAMLQQISQLQEQVKVLSNTSHSTYPIATNSTSNITSSTNNSNNTTSYVQNNYIINNNPNGQIQLKPFGQERTDHITESHINHSLHNCDTDGFFNLFKLIHLNKEVPENQNVRYKSLKQKIIEVYDGEKWSQHSADWVLEKIVYCGWKILQQHYIDLKMLDLENENHVISKVLADVGTRSGQQYYRIKNEIFMILRDHSDRGTLCVVDGSSDPPQNELLNVDHPPPPS